MKYVENKRKQRNPDLHIAMSILQLLITELQGSERPPYLTFAEEREEKESFAKKARKCSCQ